MNLTEILTEVYALTKRPDLVTQSTAAVRAVTLRAHHLDFWARDLREEIVDFSTAAFTRTWAYKVAYPRFRAVNYIIKCQHPSNEPYGKPLVNRPPLASFDDYGIAMRDVWYMAGTNIQISFTEEVRKIAIGFYQHPNIDAPNYESWIADDFPWLIINRAAARILSSIGHDDLAAAAKSDAMEQEALLRLSNTQDEGY
jgi:hypothetical protein